MLKPEQAKPPHFPSLSCKSYIKRIIAKVIKALILTPTRELAIQIGECFSAYGKYTGLRHAVIFGGVGQKPQTDELKRGVQILVATPGRLQDLVNQGFINLKALEFFVLDEADRMLDMGFYDDIMQIVKFLPKERQTIMFSATMPAKIQQLAGNILNNPAEVKLAVSKPAEKIVQAATSATRIRSWASSVASLQRRRRNALSSLLLPN